MGPGQRPCPRCTGGVRRRDHYCRSCGLDVSRLPPPPPPVDTHPRARFGPQTRVVPYRPLAPSTVALRLVVGVIALTGLALAAVSVVVWRRLGGEVTMVSLPDIELDWAVLQSWVQGLAVVQVGLLVVASVLMIRWTAQAARNIAALRVGGTTMAPRWATWRAGSSPGSTWCCPAQVVAELWRTADATCEVESTAWKSRSAPTGLNLWWICTLVALPTVLLAGTELASVGEFPPAALVDLHNAQSAFVLLAVAEGLMVFAAALFARVLTDITERQAARMTAITRVLPEAEPVKPPAPSTPPRTRSWRRPSPGSAEVDPPVLVHAGLDGSPIGRY